MNAFGWIEGSDPDDLPTEAGIAVHRFASQPDPWVRHAVDLSALTEDQVSWLLSLPLERLARLAEEGPAACGRTARCLRLRSASRSM